MKRILSYILTLGLLMPSTARVQEFIDLSGDHSLQTIVHRGTETLYNGHPTTVTLGDGTILCAWSKGHGGPAGFLARTTDGGRTWKVEDASKTLSCTSRKDIRHAIFLEQSDTQPGAQWSVR